MKRPLRDARPWRDVSRQNMKSNFVHCNFVHCNFVHCNLVVFLLMALWICIEKSSVSLLLGEIKTFLSCLAKLGQDCVYKKVKISYSTVKFKQMLSSITEKKSQRSEFNQTWRLKRKHKNNLKVNNFYFLSLQKKCCARSIYKSFHAPSSVKCIQ